MPRPKASDPAFNNYINEKIQEKHDAEVVFKDFYTDDALHDKARELLPLVRKQSLHEVMRQHPQYAISILIAGGILHREHCVEMKIGETKAIGTFKVSSGELVVTDPCYEGSTADVEEVKNGTWTAHTIHRVDWGIRVFGLMATHSSVKDLKIPTAKAELVGWKEAGVMSVDSGQGCIVDAKHFGGGENGDHDAWYDRACKLTLDTKGSAGVLKGGCVSSSGCGDGGYAFYTQEHDGEVVAVWIDYFGVDREKEEA